MADSPSNTVMGDAVSDAATWYESADWAGLSSTPKSKTVLEFHLSRDSSMAALGSAKSEEGFGWLYLYNVPLKDGSAQELYTIDWASAFFDQALTNGSSADYAEQYFLELMSQYTVPKGTENKYRNTQEFFYKVKERRANKQNQADA